MTDNNIIEIYTDGACRHNPGPGGWAALLRYNGHEKQISGAKKDTTNNQMELQAAIEALQCLKTTSTVHLYTDSQYVKNGITQWIQKWKNNRWRTANGGAVKNQQQWQLLDALTAKHDVKWFWVKGHSDHPENDLVDQLAREAINSLR